MSDDDVTYETDAYCVNGCGFPAVAEELIGMAGEDEVVELLCLSCMVERRLDEWVARNKARVEITIDPLGPSKGVLFGMFFGGVAWATGVAVVWYLLRG